MKQNDPMQISLNQIQIQIQMDDSPSISRKTRFALTTVVFIALFFFSIVLFSKRTLEPSISVYQESFSVTTSHIHSLVPPFPDPPPPSLPPPAGSEPLNLSTHQDPIPSISQTVKLDSSSNATSVDDPFSAPKKQNPPAGNGAAPEKRNPPPPNNGVVRKGEVKKRETCDLYTGTWVRDEEYPIYKPGSCPYVDEAFDCHGNGRKDYDYLRWRWKPDGCDLPRFNATDFLERLRGKRLMLVGDSMNRNQFESILCLLFKGLTDKSKMYEVNGNKVSKGRGYFLFKIKDYNCTVEFVRSHFLVRQGSRTLSLDLIDKSSRKWKRADILIFNTAHWWVHGKTARGRNYYKEGDYLYPKFDAMEAYRRALKTWAKWIDDNIKPTKQLVFFRGYSSAHFRGGDWNSGGTCHGETEPILKRGAFLETYPPKMKIVEEVIREMKFPVALLNITRLTNSRKDGHPSIYRKGLTEGKKVSSRHQDCSHWCLPGVPDTWNELIYANLFFNEQFSRGKKLTSNI